MSKGTHPTLRRLRRRENLQHQLRAAIELLEDCMRDADKVERGMAGDPGTRLRKRTTEVTERMVDLREAVLDRRRKAKGARRKKGRN